MGAGYSGLFHGTKGSHDIEKHIAKIKTINKNLQNRHIIGTKEYIEGRSLLTISISEAQNLITKFSGTGEIQHNNSKELVDFGVVIGYYVDINTNIKFKTTRGTIHYSTTGCHIVPAKPLIKGKLKNDK